MDVDIDVDVDVDVDADVVDGDDGKDDASTALLSIVAEIPRGSGFDRIALSTSLLPVTLTSMLFSSMFLLPFGIIAESLDPPSLKCNDAVLFCFVLLAFLEFACNCAGKAIHPTANGSNHIAP